MEIFSIVLIIVNIIVIGFVVSTLSSINEKLELLIRIRLKKDDIHFSNEDMEDELIRYRDK
ncbi:hypothetical protein EJF36_16575 [Bacillus sp. HMF5848]|uniref:hypothetical protein n=1 Tax=Bacillus sp. HMF5848 TaxID=2495421 RepID=UPI000F7AADA0|nr:hypothetical protein [Bacillus sp. HMF5848]RSK28348.1 hypothetical protein EJF36_16575 [Bacillus sp. HMF5848]